MNLEVAQHVAEALTSDERLLLDRRPSMYVCPICDHVGGVEDRPSVLLYRAGTSRAMRLAHTDCSPSEIIATSSFPDEDQWEARAGVVAHGDNAIPIVIAEPLTAPARIMGDNRVDATIGELLASGLHLLTGTLPPPVAPSRFRRRWQLQLTGSRSARILTPHGLMYDGPLSLSRSWHQASDALGGLRRGRCVLYAGIGLEDAMVSDDFGKITGYLDRAAQNGLLTGALIMVDR